MHAWENCNEGLRIEEGENEEQSKLASAGEKERVRREERKMRE
jgi:hypothetical protein